MNNRNIWSDVSIPLYVDLDGTLIQTDSLWETLILLIKQKPLFICFLPWWLLKGRAYFKHKIAESVDLSSYQFPYQTELSDFLIEQHQKGRRVILATAANIKITQKIKNELPVFSDVLASTTTINLKGKTKLKAIQQHNNNHAFHYAGNSSADIPIWNAAVGVIQINPSRKLQRYATKALIFNHANHTFTQWLKCLRVHQWIKNSLVAIPLITSHNLFNFPLIKNTLLGFFAFSLCTSSVYIINDLLDLGSDRAHPHKKYRPFATGNISISSGIYLIPFLLLISGLLSSLLPHTFQLILLCYFIITLLYSFYLKKRLLIDVFVLAGLYVTRIIAGTFAIDVYLSDWLLTLSLFLFLSLAFAKRYIELRLFKDDELPGHSLSARGYQLNDIPMLAVAGMASSYIAIVVIALYITSDAVIALYNHPIILWFLCPILLYWTNRIWLLAARGAIHTDPLSFSVKDKMFYLVVLALLVTLFLAS